jgi:hypothetical protein
MQHTSLKKTRNSINPGMSSDLSQLHHPKSEKAFSGFHAANCLHAAYHHLMMYAHAAPLTVTECCCRLSAINTPSPRR